MFFGCNFSQEVWHKILICCGLAREVWSWNEEALWAVKKLRGKALIVLVLRIALNAMIYMTWSEMNNKFFNKKEGIYVEALKKIKEVIKFRLTNLKHIRPNFINTFFILFMGLSHSIFN